MRKTNIKNPNTKNITIFMASLLFIIAHLATTSSLYPQTPVFAVSQTDSHKDNSNFDKSNSNINGNHPLRNSIRLVCESSITTCPPPTGGSSGAII